MDAETHSNNAIDYLYNTLTQDEKDNLSKVLFPNTHTKQLNILGKVRDLEPLTVKWSKQLRSAMQPYAKALETAIKDPNKVEDQDMQLLDGISHCCRILCAKYGWDDIRQALDDDELTTSDLQAIAVAQLNLQGENDFLATPLRVACMVMRTAEIQSLRLQTIFSGGMPAKH